MILLTDVFGLEFYSTLIQWVFSRVLQTLLWLLKRLELDQSWSETAFCLFEDLQLGDCSPSLQKLLDIHTAGLSRDTIKINVRVFVEIILLLLWFLGLLQLVSLSETRILFVILNELSRIVLVYIFWSIQSAWNKFFVLFLVKKTWNVILRVFCRRIQTVWNQLYRQEILIFKVILDNLCNIDEMSRLTFDI